MAKKGKNLNTENVEELKEKLNSLYENLRSIKFKTQGAKSKNVKEASSIKKDIARILTKIKNLGKK